MRVVRLSLAAAISLVIFGAAAARADIIFDGFGAGNVFNDTQGWTIGNGSSTNAPAELFLSNGNYSLSEIDLALSHVTGSNHAVVSLWTATADAPDTELGSWYVSGEEQFGSAVPISVLGVSGVTLASGEHYFLKVAPGNGDNTFDVWNLSNLPLDLPLYENGEPASSPVAAAAFRLIGTPVLNNAAVIDAPLSVPEPQTIVLLAAGLICLVIVRRSSKQQAS